MNNRNLYLKSWLMISSLLFLSACGCSGSKGDGCGLAAVYVIGAVTAPVWIVARPIIEVTKRGPEPRIDDKNNRIRLELDAESENTIASLEHSAQEAHHLKDNTFRRSKYTVTWQNVGPQYLSGSHTFEGPMSEITALPNSNMVLVPVTLSLSEKKSKIFLLDLASNQVKLEIPINDIFVDTVVSPSGNYLLLFSSSGFDSHQIDVYELMNFTYIGSISTGEHYHFSYPIFDSNRNRFTTYIRDKIYSFNIITN